MTLRPNEPGLRVAVGVSRSGKTYGIRSDVVEAARLDVPVMVIDRVREWTSAPVSLVGRSTIVRTVEHGARLVRDAGVRLVVVQTSDAVGASIEACEWARDFPGVAGVCFNEAHRAAPAGRARLPQAIDDVVSAWAHHRVALWADSQRLAKLHSDLTENATELRLYAMVGVRDLAVLRELGGAELAERVREAASRFAEGAPGYHVRLSSSRVGPYELTR